MPYEFRLPDLGEGITEAEIRKWLVKEGDVVAEHQSVLEVETDKAVAEVPSPKAGKVLKLGKEEGEIAHVGDILLVLETVEAKAAEKPAGMPAAETAKPEIPEAPQTKPEEKERESVTVMGTLPEAGEEEPVLALPAARALAKEMGFADLRKIRGSGPGGAITREDVLRHSREKTFKADEDGFGPVERVPLRGLRRTISKNMVAAQRATAFVTGMEEADVTDLWELREREKGALKKAGLHLTFLPFFIKAAQHALREFPALNAAMDDQQEEIVLKKYYNFGIAVATPEGLMVPVLKDVDKKTIMELSKEIEDLSGKARDRKIALEDLKGNSFTITNYGHFGGFFATPIINAPDTAILGTGRIAEKPWVYKNKIEIRKILHLSLTFDHRVTDGAEAAQFLTRVVQLLEDPALIFIESA
ncbi:MAG: dihydrolipoamide acetyltransferase family protein [Nitrospiraceae bacterium]|nr:dihydrolipoamide acetyltransferase family protein [Nitrospiraceae bacterium]